MIRTCDTGFRRAVLYPLSYEGGDRVRVYRPRAVRPPRRSFGKIVKTSGVDR